MQLLIALVLAVWWFWFADISLTMTAITLAGCAASWSGHRAWVLKDPEMLQNFFATLFMVGGAVGIVIGTPALIYKLL